MLTREGGHHANRIVHAGGDATGAEVQRALHAAVRRDPWIRLVEHALVLDLLRDADRPGLRRHPARARRGHRGRRRRGAGPRGRARHRRHGPDLRRRPPTRSVSTGDGVALALRAGAAVTDVEFVQFHPTVVRARRRRRRSAQQPLVSEALRGEGAHLVDADGKRFMVGQHELAELAPRDVVAKGIHRVLLADRRRPRLPRRPAPGRTLLEPRFPTITASCRAAGVDPATDLIPVAPAAHYATGGVRTDLHGRTSIPGLYACGEVACTGVHGANRLASQLAAGGSGLRPPDRRRHRAATCRRRPTRSPAAGAAPAWVVAAGDPRRPLQRAMTRGAGVLRTRRLAGRAAAGRWPSSATARPPPRTAAWEATNLLTVADARWSARPRRRRGDPRLPLAGGLPRGRPTSGRPPARRHRRRRRR